MSLTAIKAGSRYRVTCNQIFVFFKDISVVATKQIGVLMFADRRALLLIKYAGAFLCMGSFASPATAQQEVCNLLEGAVVVNEAGEYLGVVSGPYVQDSIFNEYGVYGSEYRSESIWNEYGKNGSEFQSNTAFNAYANKPPKLIKNGRVVAFLTVNKSISGGVNPRLLGIVCYDFKPPH